MMNGCPRWSFLTLPLLAALGCSDPVPRPAQGNLTLSIQPPAGAGTCVMPQTYVVGNPKGPNNAMAGDRLIDGEHGATIKCSVHGSGPFTFSATIKGLSSASDPVTLTITNGTINADKMAGTATVAVNTPQLANTFSSAAGACPVTVVGTNVKPGSLWATVSCPNITDPSTPGKACSVGPITTFVLENCDGS
jgi:hypothetical protein